MAKTDEAKRTRPSLQTAMVAVVLIISVVVAGWALITISAEAQLPSSDFVSLPTTSLSKNGVNTMLVSVSAVFNGGVAVGVKGFLQTSTGSPIVGAMVYMTYFLQGAYRTQAATTDASGHFEVIFPMNWTGWLPLTLTYFGDSQHQGLKQVFSVSGEN